jgi:hypothetical protein
MSDIAINGIALRVPTISRTSGAWKDVARSGVARAVLDGRVLVVDPSIGSKRAGKEGGSLPGYSIWVGGHLEDSGTITTRDHGGSTHRRLVELARSLRDDFPGQWDVLVVEDIPMLRFEKFGRSLASQIPLHRATGAILASVDATHLVEIHPATWRAFLADAEDYDAREGEVGAKGDESDAIVLGFAAQKIADAVFARAAVKGRRSRKRAG